MRTPNNMNEGSQFHHIELFVEEEKHKEGGKRSLKNGGEGRVDSRFITHGGKGRAERVDTRSIICGGEGRVERVDTRSIIIHGGEERVDTR